MRAACLSGWGQSPAALSHLWPGATSIDYAALPGEAEALARIEAQARGCELLIGWSLGGQLLVRAVAERRLSPRALVLIATPYQFVAQPGLTLGMPREVYRKFCDNFGRYPQKTLKKAWELIHLDDKNGENVRLQLEKQDKDAILAQNWHEWLQYLDRFTCKTLSMTRFPPTLIVHGTQDHVVRYEQSGHFHAAIPQARLLTLEDCGHAPHWHDADALRAAIGAILDV